MSGEDGNSVAAEAPPCIEPEQAQKSEPEPRRCGAQLRGKPGQCCRQFAVTGRERCRIHGGSSPRGQSHPSTRHALYSRELPANLRRDYERFLTDPELLSARREIALVRTRMVALASRLGTSESGQTWRELAEHVTSARTALGADDAAKTSAAVERLAALISGPVNDERAYDEFTLFVERASLLMARETKRLADERLAVSVDQVRLIVHSIAAVVLREVRDEQVRAIIAKHIEALRVLRGAEIDELATSPLDHGQAGEATG